MFPVVSLITTVISLLKGPLGAVIDHYISDLEVRQKLKAEIETSLMDTLAKAADAEGNVIIAEINSSHWLTSNWRPLLMLMFMGFLVLVGVIIPAMDLIAGHPIPYQPRWQELPTGFWDFLSIGVGGYIGGRSLEKITNQVFAPKASPK
jgi:hypothetical protein